MEEKKIQEVENNILNRMPGKWRVDRVYMEEIRGKINLVVSMIVRQQSICLKWARHDKNGRTTTSKESMAGRGQQKRMWKTED